ncbi:hypothetical protein HHX47_DHR2000543 [Lentinula edodes]|nr:hypothetical protein HHX47_DHR2000543 [Lentinula edodes]
MATDHGMPSELSFEPSASSAPQLPIPSPSLSRNGTIVELEDSHQSGMSSTPSKYKETSSRCPFPGEATECEAANDKSQPQSLNSHARSRSKKTFNPQLILENNGSVARDHLASERTFLAYVRTSLAIASTGVGGSMLFFLFQFRTFRLKCDTVEFSSCTIVDNIRFNQWVDNVINNRTNVPTYASVCETFGFCLRHFFYRPAHHWYDNFTISMSHTLTNKIPFQLGLTRYFSIQNALTLNQFPVARLMIIISSLILGALVIFTFAILVAGQS